MTTPALMPDRHPSTRHLMQYFTHDHLPERLARVSAPFGALAQHMVDEIPDGPELTTGLRKLLEAKDCMVRAALGAHPQRRSATLHADDDRGV